MTGACSVPSNLLTTLLRKNIGEIEPLLIVILCLSLSFQRFRFRKNTFLSQRSNITNSAQSVKLKKLGRSINQDILPIFKNGLAFWSFRLAPSWWNWTKERNVDRGRPLKIYRKFFCPKNGAVNFDLSFLSGSSYRNSRHIEKSRCCGRQVSSRIVLNFEISYS